MKKWHSLIILAFAFFASNSTFAQNYNDLLRMSETEVSSNARIMGMGNAFTAVGKDYSSSQFNPAGLALATKFNLSTGVNYNYLKNDAEFYNTNKSFSNSSTTFNELGFVFPLPTSRGSMVLSLGYNRTKDFTRAVKFDAFNNSNHSMIQDLTYYNDDIAYELGLSYPVYDGDDYIGDATLINGKLNQRGTIIQEGGINSWSAAGAIEFQKDLFLGATINIFNGDFKRDRDYWEEDNNNLYTSALRLDPNEPATADFISFHLNDIIKWEVSGWNMIIGLLTQIDDFTNVGFTVKLPKKFTISETYFVSGRSQFGTGTDFVLSPPIENRYKYEISTPYEFTAGAAYFRDLFLLSVDVTLIDFTQMKFSGGMDTETIEQKNKDVEELFRSVININAGGELRIPNSAITLRGGFIYLPSPFKGDPSSYDKKYITAGISISGRGFTYDLGYSYGWWEDIGDNYGSNISRTFQNISRSNLILGLRYKF